MQTRLGPTRTRLGLRLLEAATKRLKTAVEEVAAKEEELRLAREVAAKAHFGTGILFYFLIEKRHVCLLW